MPFRPSDFQRRPSFPTQRRPSFPTRHRPSFPTISLAIPQPIVAPVTVPTSPISFALPTPMVAPVVAPTMPVSPLTVISKPKIFMPRKPIPRFTDPASAARWHAANPPPGKVQLIINKVLGATPEFPITIPIKMAPVEVKASKATQNLMLGLGGIALLGVLGFMVMRRR